MCKLAIWIDTCMLSHFSHVQFCATLWTAAHQAPPSTGFSRQEYWRELTLDSLRYISSLTFCDIFEH